jgi:hypothetical protein
MSYSRVSRYALNPGYAVFRPGRIAVNAPNGKSNDESDRDATAVAALPTNDGCWALQAARREPMTVA